MRYEQHDFINNFLSLHKVGDHDKAKDILLKEIAQLIVYHRGYVIRDLNAAGIPTNKFATDKELTNKLMDHLPENKKLQASISQMLVHFNTPTNTRMGADGVGSSAVQGSASGASGGAVGAVAGAVGNIFGFFKSKTDQKTQADQNKLALAQSLLASQPTKSHTGTYVMIGAGLIAVTAILYFVLKPKHAPAAAGYGATIGA